MGVNGARGGTAYKDWPQLTPSHPAETTAPQGGSEDDEHPTSLPLTHLAAWYLSRADPAWMIQPVEVSQPPGAKRGFQKVVWGWGRLHRVTS